MKLQMMMLWTSCPILLLGALLCTCAGVHDMSPSCPFQTSEAKVIRFCGCFAIINAEGCKLKALIRRVLEFLHNQHLYQAWSSLFWFPWRWLICFLFDLDTLIGAVACIRDFISTVIQLIKALRVGGFFSLSRSLAHTFQSSAHIFCPITDNMWLYSISLGSPTSSRVL